MGNLCCQSSQDDNVVESTTEDKIAPLGAPSPRAETSRGGQQQSPETDKSSLYYFDAITTETDFNRMSTVEQENMAQSIYFDTRQSTALPYAPAPIAAPRMTIRMDAPKTLLLSTKPAKRKSVLLLLKALQEPPTTASHVQLAGYPGQLTQRELDQCLEFRQLLKLQTNQIHQKIVKVYSGVEEEPYALCRCLRARQFDPRQTLDMLGNSVDSFQKAQYYDFYRDIEGALGCPLSVFLSQFPLFGTGISKSGCPVLYFLAQGLSIEGMDCLFHLEECIFHYMWYALKHAFAEQIQLAQMDNKQLKNTVRCEMLLVVNLQGLSKSTINRRTLGLLKGAMQAVNCFPEVLNRIVIINAPYFFSYAWVIIRKIIDARTAAKVEIHSGANKKRLLDLVDPTVLLQNVGGEGLAFDQVMQEQNRDGNSLVYQTTKLLHLSPNQESKLDFCLSANEQADVSIHCKSRANVVLERDGVGKLNAVEVASTSAASGTSVAKQVKRPGMYTVVVQSKSTTKDYFLVVVQAKPFAAEGTKQ